MLNSSSSLKPEDFPIFSDLYKLIQEKAKHPIDRQVYNDLALLFYDIAEGSDRFIHRINPVPI